MLPDPKEYEHLSNWDRMIQGYPYDCNTAEIVNARDASRALVKEYNETSAYEYEKREQLLKSLLHPDCKDRAVYIEPNFRCDYGFNINFGEKAYLNFDCCILDVMAVKIGKNFFAGPSVHIYTACHPTNPVERRSIDFAKPVTIGDDVWVGGQSTICPGVTIGNGVTIGAGSIVVKDIPDFVVVAGNPAKIIKRLEKPENYS